MPHSSRRPFRSSSQEIRQSVEPGDLILKPKVGVGRARVWHHEDPGLADRSWPRAELDAGRRFGERIAGEGAVAGRALKAGDAGLVGLQTSQQMRHPGLKESGGHFRSASAGLLDDVGKADAEGQEGRVVLRAEGVAAESGSDGCAQPGALQGGPKAVRPAGEVVAALDRVEAWVDADEEEIEPRGQVIREGRRA